MGKKKKEVVQPEIKEFVRSQGNTKKAGNHIDVKLIVFLAVFVVVLVGAILCGILLCKEPIATVIIVAVLEAVLSFCLCKTQIWLHGAVVILNVVLGFIFKMPLYLVLAALVYVAGVLAVHQIEGKVSLKY